MSFWSKSGVTVCLCVAFAAQAQTITGVITTIAGNGTQGFAGDSGPAASANMNQPYSAVIAGGNLYIADQVNNAIRMVNGSGTITTFAGANGSGFSGDNGKATLAQLASPTGVAVDSSGNVYIADTVNDCIRKVSSSGVITTFAGIPQNPGYDGDGGGAAGAALNRPAGMAFDSNGNLYVADSGNNVIRKIAMDSINTITTYAGSYAKSYPTPSYTGDGGSALNAGMNDPTGIAFDSQGNLYIADSNNNVIRKVGTAPTYTVTTVAGNGTAGFSGDGIRAPKLSMLSHPNGVAVDAAGNIYIADTINSRIRLVPPNLASINTVIGTGQPAYFGDGGPALQAALNFPRGLSFDSSGNLIVSDTGNSVIRKFVPGASTSTPPAISAGGVISASQFGAFSTAAPGAWVEIYGTNLAASTTDWSNAFVNGIAPNTLAGTTVTIAGLNAFIDYVSPTQVNAQIPFGVTAGQQQLTLSTAAGQSGTYSINVLTTDPGLLSQYAIGGKAYVSAFHSDGSLVAPAGAISGVTSSPAKVGELITMYGIGFGTVTKQPADGQPDQGQNSLTTPLNIFFGGLQATLQYWGLAPNYLGLYQFNVYVPNVASGSAIPLTFLLGSTNGAQTLYTAVQ